MNISDARKSIRDSEEAWYMVECDPQEGFNSRGRAGKVWQRGTHFIRLTEEDAESLSGDWDYFVVQAVDGYVYGSRALGRHNFDVYVWSSKTHLVIGPVNVQDFLKYKGDDYFRTDWLLDGEIDASLLTSSEHLSLDDKFAGVIVADGEDHDFDWYECHVLPGSTPTLIYEKDGGSILDAGRKYLMWVNADWINNNNVIGYRSLGFEAKESQTALSHYRSRGVSYSSDEDKPLSYFFGKHAAKVEQKIPTKEGTDFFVDHVEVYGNPIKVKGKNWYRYIDAGQGESILSFARPRKIKSLVANGLAKDVSKVNIDAPLSAKILAFLAESDSDTRPKGASIAHAFWREFSLISSAIDGEREKVKEESSDKPREIGDPISWSQCSDMTFASIAFTKLDDCHEHTWYVLDPQGCYPFLVLASDVQIKNMLTNYVSLSAAPVSKMMPDHVHHALVDRIASSSTMSFMDDTMFGVPSTVVNHKGTIAEILDVESLESLEDSKTGQIGQPISWSECTEMVFDCVASTGADHSTWYVVEGCASSYRNLILADESHINRILDRHKYLSAAPVSNVPTIVHRYLVDKIDPSKMCGYMFGVPAAMVYKKGTIDGILEFGRGYAKAVASGPPGGNVVILNSDTSSDDRCGGGGAGNVVIVQPQDVQKARQIVNSNPVSNDERGGGGPGNTIIIDPKNVVAAQDLKAGQLVNVTSDGVARLAERDGKEEMLSVKYNEIKDSHIHDLDVCLDSGQGQKSWYIVWCHEDGLRIFTHIIHCDYDRAVRYKVHLERTRISNAGNPVVAVMRQIECLPEELSTHRLKGGISFGYADGQWISHEQGISAKEVFEGSLRPKTVIRRNKRETFSEYEDFEPDQILVPEGVVIDFDESEWYHISGSTFDDIAFLTVHQAEAIKSKLESLTLTRIIDTPCENQTSSYVTSVGQVKRCYDGVYRYIDTPGPFGEFISRVNSERIKEMAKDNEKKQKRNALELASELAFSEAPEALTRTAGTQLVKLCKEPLVAAISRKQGSDFAEKVGGFLETETGDAFLSVLLSLAMPLSPGVPENVKNTMSQELRVRGMYKASDALADVFMGPLRQVMSDFAGSIGSATKEATKSLTASTDTDKEDLERMKEELKSHEEVGVR